jgi:hypothetical protein
VAVSGFDLALRGGETKGRDQEMKCRWHSARRQLAGWVERSVRSEGGDNPGGPVLGRKAAIAMAWADFRKFQGKSRWAAKAIGQN